MILQFSPLSDLLSVISNALQDQEAEAEETAKVLERFVDGTSLTNAYPSAVLKPTLSFVVTPDYPNMYWLDTKDPQRQGETLALVREIVDNMPELAIIHLLYEVFVTRCQGPLGNIVHTPTFMKQVDRFCRCLALTSPEARVIAMYTTISMDQLARHLLAVRMPLYRALSVSSPSLLHTARARSRLSSHTISTWLGSYPSNPSCGRASSVRCIFQDMEVTCLALHSRGGVALLWFDCRLTNCHHALA